MRLILNTLGAMIVVLIVIITGLLVVLSFQKAVDTSFEDSCVAAGNTYIPTHGLRALCVSPDGRIVGHR